MTIAMTQDEQAETLFYLGFVAMSSNLDPYLWDSESGQVIPWGLADSNPTILRNMQNIANASLYALIQRSLETIRTIRSKFLCAADNLAVLQVDTVKLNNNQIRQLWDLDFQFCQQLANCLGVPVRDHPSKHSGYGGMITR